jgi:hypothetical protein
MVFKKLPFSKPDIQGDTKYRWFVKEPTKFWKHQLTTRKIKIISEELKDILTLMLIPDPSTGLNIRQIQSHSWFNGEIVPLEEINMRLIHEQEARRKVLNEEKQRKEEIQEFIRKQIFSYTKFNPRFNIFEVYYLLIIFN